MRCHVTDRHGRRNGCMLAMTMLPQQQQRMEPHTAGGCRFLADEDCWFAHL